MTYLQYLTQSQAATPPLEQLRLALQYYAEVDSHPQRLAFDKGAVARSALQRLESESITAITHESDVQ